MRWMKVKYKLRLRHTERLLKVRNSCCEKSPFLLLLLLFFNIRH